MRLPGTLKELSKQLAAFPCRVTRFELREDGALLMEFGEANPAALAQAAAPPRAREQREVPKDDGSRPSNPKIRDTRLLAQTPPLFREGDAPS